MRRRWRAISKLWDDHKSRSSELDLLGRLDYHGELLDQRQADDSIQRRIRVLYGASGFPTATITTDADTVIDHKLYWIPCTRIDEANYLVGIINSRTLEEAVAPFRPKGQFGSRDLHKHLWRLPIPEYDADNPLHQDIAAAAAATTQAAAAVLRESQSDRTAAGKSTDVRVLRADLRTWLAQSAEGQQVERLVAQLLK